MRITAVADARTGVLPELPGEAEFLSRQRQTQWLWAFLAIGVIARSVRYLLCFPLWEDECFLVSNYLERGYLELTQPLGYHQVAPILFMWVELTVVKCLGFSEYSLRLFPFLCGIASLFLFRHLAGRLLSGLPLVLAMATLAASYSGIRYSAEAKQYASDLLVTLVLLIVTVEWWRRPENLRWLWGLAAIAPLAIGLSYTSLFVAGGVSLAIAWSLIVSRDRTSQDAAARSKGGPMFGLARILRTGWLPWLAFNLAVAGSFAVITLLIKKSQSADELKFLQGLWQSTFPPRTTLGEFAKWLLSTHTGDMFSFPIGGQAGGSTLTFLCAAAGGALVYRSGRFAWLLLFLVPPALNLLAACLERYPYGGHVRLAQYLAPMICLLSGLGGAKFSIWCAQRWPQPHTHGRRALTVVLGLLLAVAGVTMARDFTHHYKSLNDQRSRDFARWFWHTRAFDGEVVCLKTDLQQNFSPQTFHELGWSALYLCNQRIYSPRHARRSPPAWDLVSADRPLYCVQYRESRYAYDQPAFDRWLASMESRYALIGRETYPHPIFDRGGKCTITVEYLDVFKFVPKTTLAQRAEPSIRR